MSLTEDQKKIEQECMELSKFLIAKNEKYGNSALEPIRIMSKASTVEQLLVRIDDKLSRLQNEGFYATAQGMLGNSDENTVLDVIGYYMLLMIQVKKEAAGKKEEEQESTIQLKDVPPCQPEAYFKERFPNRDKVGEVEEGTIPRTTEDSWVGKGDKV